MQTINRFQHLFQLPASNDRKKYLEGLAPARRSENDFFCQPIPSSVPSPSVDLASVRPVHARPLPQALDKQKMKQLVVLLVKIFRYVLKLMMNTTLFSYGLFWYDFLEFNKNMVKTYDKAKELTFQYYRDLVCNVSQMLCRFVGSHVSLLHYVAASLPGLSLLSGILFTVAAAIQVVKQAMQCVDSYQAYRRAAGDNKAPQRLALKRDLSHTAVMMAFALAGITLTVLSCFVPVVGPIIAAVGFILLGLLKFAYNDYTQTLRSKQKADPATVASRRLSLKQEVVKPEKQPETPNLCQRAGFFANPRPAVIRSEQVLNEGLEMGACIAH